MQEVDSSIEVVLGLEEAANDIEHVNAMIAKGLPEALILRRPVSKWPPRCLYGWIRGK